MIYRYEIDKNCEYIPIHLNVVFNSKVQDYFKDIVSKEISQNICENIRVGQKKYIVMDFDKISAIDSRIFECYVDLITEAYKFIFINLNPICMSILEDDDLKGYVKKIDEFENCLFSSEVCYENDQKYLEYCNQDKTEKFIKKIVSDYLYETREQNEQQLESTCVIANMYIDVKSVFYRPDIYVYVVYQICSLIKKRYNMRDIDYLISSSNNGAILSLLVGQLLNKKVINFVNLGPHLSLYNKEIINEIEKEKKYLLIYDFICMGTEVKLAKSIIELKDAILVGAAGIAIYIKPNLGICIDEIFQVNDDKIKNFKYTVNVRSSLC